ncbi:hypothetical protein Tco_1457209 [Tanacetum coccineum]
MNIKGIAKLARAHVGCGVMESDIFGRLQRGTDKTKITRKQSNTDKHGHGKRKSTKEAGKSNKDKKYKPLLIGTFGFMEGELVMEELPWTSLAYLRISQSC